MYLSSALRGVQMREIDASILGRAKDNGSGRVPVKMQL